MTPSRSRSASSNVLRLSTRSLRCVVHLEGYLAVLAGSVHARRSTTVRGSNPGRGTGCVGRIEIAQPRRGAFAAPSDGLGVVTVTAIRRPANVSPPGRGYVPAGR